jgi:hypothetical protein
VEFDIPSSESRGLCDECGRYNWRYYLTKHLEVQPKDAVCRYEEELVQNMLGGTAQKPAENVATLVV